jgi:hypothetical protein
MSIVDGFKTCRKGLHQYPADKKQCPECKKESKRKWCEKNFDRKREVDQRWRDQNRERARESVRRWYKNNSERHQENNRRWKAQNPEQVKENNKRWYKQNLERKQKRARQWYEQNFERVREKNRHWREKNTAQNRELVRRWSKQNPDKIRANLNRRRAMKKQAVPPWADQAAINAIYAEAIRLEKEMGIKYHVDHIYPLQSDYMCGLHVETNLQILTEKQNKKKSNRTWPGQLECQRLPLHLNGFEKIPNWSRPS